MTAFLYVLICAAGLCWGSFLNVVIVRTINGENIFFPASKCPKCDVPILWRHKIPVISYFYLHGRCSYCNSPISPMYPVVEISGFIIFLSACIKYSSIVDITAVIIILSLFLTLAIIDFKLQKISKVQAYIIMTAGIIFNGHDIFNSVSGAIAGAFLIFLLRRLGQRFLNNEVFGKGDIFILAALGAVTGFNKLFVYIVLALLSEVLIILPKYIKNLRDNGQIQTLKQLGFFTAACVLLYLFKNVSFWGFGVIFILLLLWMLHSAWGLIRALLNSISENKTPEHCPLTPVIALSCLLFFIIA